MIITGCNGVRNKAFDGNQIHLLGLYRVLISEGIISDETLAALLYTQKKMWICLKVALPVAFCLFIFLLNFQIATPKLVIGLVI